MKQEIYDDPFDLADWDLRHSSRCFVHLANSMVWRSVTGQEPPTVPITSAEYERAGLPWFDYYSEAAVVEGADKLAGLKSVTEMGAHTAHIGKRAEGPGARSRYPRTGVSRREPTPALRMPGSTRVPRLAGRCPAHRLGVLRELRHAR
jgi:hypothetical protein